MAAPYDSDETAPHAQTLLSNLTCSYGKHVQKWCCAESEQFLPPSSPPPKTLKSFHFVCPCYSKGLSMDKRHTMSVCRAGLLCVPFRRTSFARRSFRTAAPLTWNSLPSAVLNCDSLSLSLLSNPDLKLTCFILLSANYSIYLFRRRLCNRLTALWRYINFVLLLLYY